MDEKRIREEGFFKRKSRELKAALKKKYNMEDRQAFGFCYLMLLLPIISFVVFWLYVNVDSVVLAFTDASGNFTMANFKKVWNAFAHTDQYGWNLWDMMFRTWAMWAICRLCFIPQTFSTYVLYKKIPGHFIFRTIFMIPSVLGGIVWILIMKQFVTVGGPVLQLADMMGIEVSLEVQMKGLLGSTATAHTTMVLLQVIPEVFMFSFVVSGAFARIGDEMFEVGKLEGIGFIREFFTVSVPLIWPTIVISIIGWFKSLFTQDNGAFLYTGGEYETGSIGFYLFYLTKSISDEGGKAGLYGYPAALGVVFTAITVPTVLIARHYLEKVYADVTY
ncbi:MAG: sugar ABC transporter permease [Clostridia bacterium]|nr:sugar ABC transporter permease [Clostridia bacterium]